MFVVLLDPDCNWDLSRRSYWAGGRWLVVDVLVEVGLVRNLETFSECDAWKMLCTMGNSGGNSSW